MKRLYFTKIAIFSLYYLFSYIPGESADVISENVDISAGAIIDGGNCELIKSQKICIVPLGNNFILDAMSTRLTVERRSMDREFSFIDGDNGIGAFYESEEDLTPLETAQSFIMTENIGWFPIQREEDKICVLVFVRANQCGYLAFLKGKIEVNQLRR